MKIKCKTRSIIRLWAISLVVIVFGCFGIFGCGSDSDSNYSKSQTSESSQTEGPFTMTNFFPLTSSWETDQWTLFVDLREHDINGVMTKAMVDTGTKTVMFMTCDGNGLRIHAFLDDDGELVAFSSPIVFADSVVSVGDKAEGTFMDDVGEMTIIVELVGVEDVSVPAGNFSDCLKFTVFGYPSAGNPDDYGKETIWFAEGVGFVKAQTDENADVSLFADNGETRQLLSYHITPSDLTADELAIREVYKTMCDYDEAGDIDAVIELLSDDYFDRKCRDKDDIYVSWGNWYKESSDIKEFVTLEDVSIDGDDAYVLQESLLTYINDDSGERYLDWARQLRRFKKEGDDWKYYGAQMAFKLDWYNAWVRNTVDGSYLALSVGFIDCDGNMIDPRSQIASLTVTGPPGTFTDLDLTLDYYPDDFEYWYSEDIANAKSGFYTLEIVDNDGNIFVTTDYLQIAPLLDVPNLVSPAEDAEVPPGNVTLDWADVAQADYYRVELERWDGENWIRENKYPGESEVVFNGLDPETDFRWRIRARQNDVFGENDNESRCDWRDFTTTRISFDYAHLQYRTYEDGSHAYRGWCEFSSGPDPITSEDITGLVLKDPSGGEISIEYSFDSSYLFYYNGYYNDTTGDIDYSEGSPYSGFMISFPDETALSSGTYTYEATTSDDVVLTYTVYYPGDVTMPVVDPESVNSSIDEAQQVCILNWENPEGEYDQIRFNFFDQDGYDWLLIRPDVNAETLTIPLLVLGILEDEHPIDSMTLEIQTRLYADDGNNYARGCSYIIED